MTKSVKSGIVAIKNGFISITTDTSTQFELKRTDAVAISSYLTIPLKYQTKNIDKMQ